MKGMDEEIMLAYQKGEPSAFEELYRRYSGRVYGYLRNRLADRGALDDVFQAVFLKLHQSRAQYDPAFPFAPWLFTICRTVLTDSLRKTQGGEHPALAQDAALMDAPAPALVAVEAPGLPELGGLAPQQREALELRYLKDASFEEIARKLGTSSANVRQLVSRAVRKLRKGALS
ncbi:MAG: sigma-70 family RNA polymerase sigma factor [Oligoflexia bacterium]|nr:sigma-70 family RNA polymerase sigma factor [Oligoflexia bacterium]